MAAGGCHDATPETTGRSVQHLRATPGGVDILTYHGDNLRSGWNRHETTLSPANVRAETFGQIAQARDVEGDIGGDPLFVSNLTLHDNRASGDVTADVLFVGTMDARVYAVDADDLGVMWRFDFEGRGAPTADHLVSCQSPYQMGVLGTPVISPDKSLLYVVSRVFEGDETSNNWLQGYAIHTRDGTIASRFIVGETRGAGGTRTPVVFHGMDRGTPIDVPFVSHQMVQRSALLLEGNYLYVSVGGICDTPGFRGWLFAYDVRSLSESAAPAGVFVPSPQGGGGMWAGGGQASDGANVYAVVGNGRAAIRAGSADAMRSIADAVVKLSPTVALDTHACFNTTTLGACGASDTANLSNVFMPRNGELLARDNVPDMDPAMDIAGPDEDYGASGPMLVPPAELPENMGVDMGRRLLVAGGKDGFLYLVDRDHMGGVGPSALAADSDFANLVGAELWGRELYMHSTSGGMRMTPAYLETHSGRYVFANGVDTTPAADAAQGVVALRLTRGADPSPAECAGQYRMTAFQNGTMSLPCPTIWGGTMRPGFEVAWTGTGGTDNGGLYVSSNGADNGVVWVTRERGGADGTGLLQAYAADPGAGLGSLMPPIYSSDRVPTDDHLPGSAATFATPIVANGRVYVTGSTYLVAYGLLPAPRTLPALPEPPPPPPCPDGVTWESMGHPFTTHYCTSCHNEYNNLAFIQRRRDRVAESILPAMGGTPRMPLVQPGATNPVPTDTERAAMSAWLLCGAPGMATRLHAGYADLAAPGGAFVADASWIAPNQAGTLSANRLTAGVTVTNAFAPAVPDAVFGYDRSGVAQWQVPVSGAGHYAVTLYFADMACAGASCPPTPFDVALAGHPFLTGFDIGTAAGGARRVVARSTALDLPAGARLQVDVTAPGRLSALDVIRTDPCTADAMCPLGFACVAGACAVNAERADGGVGGDAGTVVADAGDGGTVLTDAGFPDGSVISPDGAVILPDGARWEPDATVSRDDGANSDASANGDSGRSGHGCSCRAAGSAPRSHRAGHSALALVALAALFARRRPRSRT